MLFSAGSCWFAWFTQSMCAVHGPHKVSSRLPLSVTYLCLLARSCSSCSLAGLSSQSPDSNRYVGFSQQEGARRQSSVGSYPQSGLAQASIQPSNAKLKSSLKPGYSQLFSSGGPTAAHTQVAPSSKDSTRFVQSSSLSRPNLHIAEDASSSWANAQAMPKRPLSAGIVSGGSLSRSSQSGASRSGLPVQQGAARAGSYPSSSSSALNRLNPSKAQQSSYSPKQFTSGVGEKVPTNTQTSASARGRRVSARRSSKSTRFTPRAGMASGSMFSAQGYHLSSQSFNGQVNFQPRTSGSQRLSYSSGSMQASQSSSNNAASSGQRFAPTTTYNIPAQFGGFAIRRLKEPAGKKKVALRKPAQVYTAPSQVNAAPPQVYAPPAQQTVSKPQAPSKHPAGKWQRVRPQSTLVGEYMFSHTFFCD